MKTIPVQPIPENVFERLGYYWYRSPDNGYYVADELVVVRKQEAEAYYDAANELFGMYVQAAQYVIDHRLYDLLDIPKNLVEVIGLSWEDDSQYQLIGRFDFAGGLDGHPIKLIEFNADTPSLIFEVALIQWMLLRHNHLPEERQYNSLYETLKSSFGRMKALHPDFSGDPNSIPHALFSCLNAGLEDENTTRLMEEIAYETGYITGFEYVDKVHFSEEGITNAEGDVFDFWYKYIPYELIGQEEPELVALLTDIVRQKKVRLINPPYTLLFQSKGIMKVMWDLYPGHPLLLETAMQPLKRKRCVEKPTLGREGANIRILDKWARPVDSTDGEYGGYKAIYQEFAEFPVDEEGRLYQAGVFFSSEACGLGFRRERGIINNHSQFVGHYVEME
jgi:glutathionylspermidine synthase